MDFTGLSVLVLLVWEFCHWIGGFCPLFYAELSVIRIAELEGESWRMPTGTGSGP